MAHGKFKLESLVAVKYVNGDKEAIRNANDATRLRIIMVAVTAFAMRIAEHI